ncbi:MAG: DUF177 domain-containing protein [Elusimicrobia bacterium]|nr:DUF177 domain-containing protein [Elusimicrobiota bacterium]
MIIETQGVIEEGGYNFCGRLDKIEDYAPDYPLEMVRLISPLHVEFDISVGSKELLLFGDVSGEFRLVCSRCNEAFDERFKQELEETYAINIPQINVGEQIRQAIVLGIPGKPLCRVECRGLCHQCGTNFNRRQCQCKPTGSNPFAKLKNVYHS